MTDNIEQGQIPDERVETGPPTHVYIHEDGSTSLVYPDGYDEDSLIELPRPPEPFEFWNSETETFTVDVNEINVYLQNKIDQQVGELRRQFVTDITGQQAAYDRKFIEADTMLKGGEGPFPILTLEASLKNTEVEALATQIVGLGKLWIDLDNAVEAHRCGAKWAVEQAETAQDKLAAAEVNWYEVIAPILAANQP